MIFRVNAFKSFTGDNCGHHWSTYIYVFSRWPVSSNARFMPYWSFCWSNNSRRSTRFRASVVNCSRNWSQNIWSIDLIGKPDPIILVGILEEEPVVGKYLVIYFYLEYIKGFFQHALPAGGAGQLFQNMGLIAGLFMVPWECFGLQIGDQTDDTQSK